MTDVFEGRRQLIVYHANVLEDRGIGCPSCSASWTRSVTSPTAMRATRRSPPCRAGRSTRSRHSRRGWLDVSLVLVATGSDFNYDFHVSFDESRAAIEYNYLEKPRSRRPACDREWTSRSICTA